MKSPSKLTVPLDAGGAVTALAYPADRPRAALILGHGAGAGQQSAFMVGFAQAIANLGIDTVTFNFPYTEQRRRAPDRAPMLEACYRSAIETVRAAIPGARPHLFIGGKSMGGRVASMVADNLHAAGRIAGLVCLGYPFHPPGKPETLRTAHLEHLQAPALIVQGTRDEFGNRADVATYRLAAGIELMWLEDGDHDLKPRKSVSGLTSADHLRTAARQAARWMAAAAG